MSLHMAHAHGGAVVVNLPVQDTWPRLHPPVSAHVSAPVVLSAWSPKVVPVVSPELSPPLSSRATPMRSGRYAVPGVVTTMPVQVRSSIHGYPSAVLAQQHSPASSTSRTLPQRHELSLGGSVRVLTARPLASTKDGQKDGDSLISNGTSSTPCLHSTPSSVSRQIVVKPPESAGLRSSASLDALQVPVIVTCASTQSLSTDRNAEHAFINRLVTPQSTISTDRTAETGLSNRRFGPGDASAHTQTRARDRVRREAAMPSGSPRVSHNLVLKYECGGSITDKYVVDWGTRLDIGTCNGLGGSSLSLFLKAKVKGSGGLCAVKVLRKSSIRFPKLLRRQLADIRQIEHFGICRVRDVFEDSSNVYIVLDYLAGPSLLEKASADPNFSERDAALALKAVLEIIAHFHSQNITYLNVHPENLRYMKASAKKGGAGSSYDDQLKLIDFGLSLHAKLSAGLVRIANSSDSQTLPLLPLLSARASSGEKFCTPPEYCGVEERHANSISSFLSSFFSGLSLQPLDSPQSSFRGDPATPKTNLRHSSSRSDLATPNCDKKSLNSSQIVPLSHSASKSQLSQELNKRPPKDACWVLQAADLWAAGCLLHILLTGTSPSQPKQSRTLGMPSSGTYDELGLPGHVSDSARELCNRLLRQNPQERPSAEEALQSDWFRECESWQKSHRSQRNKGSGAASSASSSARTSASNGVVNDAVVTPFPQEVREALARHNAQCQLRKLVTTAQMILCSLVPSVGASDSQLTRASLVPFPPGEIVPEDTKIRELCKAALDFKCRRTFQAMVLSSPSGAPPLPYRTLNEIISGTRDLPWKDPLGYLSKLPERCRSDGLMLEDFCEFVWNACQ